MKLVNEDWPEVKDIAGEIGDIAIKGYNVMKGEVVADRRVRTRSALGGSW